MKKALAGIISVVFGAGSLTAAFCQTDDSHNSYNINATYRLPIERNGLTESSFKIVASIKVDRWEKIANLILNVRSTQSTPLNPDPSYLQSYNYNGTVYGNQHVGTDAFTPVYASNIFYEVNISDGKHRWVQVVDGRSNVFGPVDKNLKAAEVSVYVKIAKINFFNGTNFIESKIKAFINAATTKIAPSNDGVVRNTTAVDDIMTATSSTSPRPSSNTQVAGAGKISTETENGIMRKPATAEPATKTWTQEQKDNYTAAANASFQSKQNAVNNAGTTNNGLSAAVNTVSSIFAAQQIENARERQQAYQAKVQAQKEERERAEQAANEALITQQRKERLMEARTNLIEKFGNGKMPLSSTKTSGDEVYFFSFSIVPLSSGRETALMNLSEVFPVAKLGDGTWQFTDILLDKIAKFNKGRTPSISGFYNTQKEAEDRLSEFKESVKNAEIEVAGVIDYKGRRALGKNSDADFWGNGKEPTQTAPTVDKAAVSAADFWENPVKAPAEKPGKKPSPVKKDKLKSKK
ncbi:hypothetical protein ACXZ1K_08780 [Pedobacter sp. PWIIR3]